jgi:large subunit ribosomal protein L25
MKAIVINAKLREKTGKKESNKLRKSEMIPCVLYGIENNIHFSAPESDFRHLVYTSDVVYAQIKTEENEYKAVMKDIQFHPVSDKILHVDFLNIHDDKPIVVSVPVKIEGFAKGVQDGGKLTQDVRRLKVKGLINDFINEILLDVTNLGIGKAIKVSDINLNNLEIVEMPNKSVVSVKVTRVAKETTETPASGATATAAPAVEAKK